MGNQESASAGIHVEGSVSASGAVDAGAAVDGQSQARAQDQAQADGPSSPKKRRLSFGSFRRSFRIRRSRQNKSNDRQTKIEMEGGTVDNKDAAARAAGMLKGSRNGKPDVDVKVAAPLATDETENMDLDAELEAGGNVDLTGASGALGGSAGLKAGIPTGASADVGVSGDMPSAGASLDVSALNGDREKHKKRSSFPRFRKRTPAEAELDAELPKSEAEISESAKVAAGVNGHKGSKHRRKKDKQIKVKANVPSVSVQGGDANVDMPPAGANVDIDASLPSADANLKADMTDAKGHTPKKGGFFAGIARFFTGDSDSDSSDSDSDSDSDDKKRLKLEGNLPNADVSAGADVSGGVGANLDVSGAADGDSKLNIERSKGSPRKGKKGARFKLPKFGRPQVNGDAAVEVPDADLAGVAGFDIEAPDVVMKADADVKTPKPDLNLGGGVKGDVELEGKGAISGPSIHVPSPAFGGDAKIGVNVPDASAGIEGGIKAPTVGIAVDDGDLGFKRGISGPNIDVAGPAVGYVDVGTKVPDASIKVGGDVKAPRFSRGGGLGIKGGIDGPEVDIGAPAIGDAKGPKGLFGISGDVKAPEVAGGVGFKGDIAKPDMNIASPAFGGDANVGMKRPDGSFGDVDVKPPGFGSSAGELGGLQEGVGISKPQIGGDVDIGGTVNMPSSSGGAGINVTPPSFGVGISSGRPDFKGEVAEPDAGLYRPGIGVDTKVYAPNADIDVPSFGGEVGGKVPDVSLTGDVKSPDIGGFNAAGGIEAKGNIAGPNIDVSVPSGDASISKDLPDAQLDVDGKKDKGGFHFRFPKFRFPSFGSGDRKAKGNISVKKPDGKLDTNADIDVTGDVPLPSGEVDAGVMTDIDVSGSADGPDVDAKLTGPEGSMQFQGGADVKLKTPKASGDVSGSLNADSPEVDANIKTGKKKGFHFGFPSFSFGGRGSKVDGPDAKVGADMKPQGDLAVNLGTDVDVQKPKGNIGIDIGATGVDAGADLPEAEIGGGFKGPSVSAGADLKGSLDTDGKVGPQGSFQIRGPGVDLDGPDVEGVKQSIDVDVKASKPKADIDIPSGKVAAGGDLSVDVDAPDIDAKLDLDGKATGKGSKFNLPGFGLPTFKGKAKVKGGVDVDGDVDVATGAKVPSVDVDVSAPGGEVSMEVDSPDVDANVSLDGKNKAPKKKAGGGFHLPSFNFGFSGSKQRKGSPDLNVEGGAEGNVKLPEGVAIGGTGVGVDIDGKKPDIDLLGKEPDVSIEGDVAVPDTDLNVSVDGKKKGFNLPSFGFGFKEKRYKGDADIDVDLNVKGDVRGPKMSGPDVDLEADGDANMELPEGAASLSVCKPSIGGSADIDIDGKASTPDIDFGKGTSGSVGGTVSAPDTDVSLAVGSKKKSPKKKGRFHLPSFGFGFKGKRDGSSSDSDSDDDKKGFGLKGGIKGPKIKGDAGGKLKGPEISGDVNGPDFDVKGGGGIGFGVAGGIDVPKGDVDLNLPKGSIDVEGPELGGVDKSLDVSVKAPKPKGDISVDVPGGKIGVDADIDVDADFDRGKRKGSGKKKGRFHMPSIHFPKGKGKGHGDADVDIDLNVEGDVKGPKMSGPDVDLNVDGGAGGNIKLPEGGVSVGGAGIGVDIDGKKPDLDLSGKGPDVSFEGDVAAPDADVNVSVDRKKKGFHLPSFGFGFKGKRDGGSSDSDSDDKKSFDLKGGIKGPKIKGDAGGKLKGPEISGDVNGPDFDVEGGGGIGFGVSGGIDVPKGDVDLNLPKGSIDVEGPELGGVDKSLDVSVKSANPKGDISVNVPSGKIGVDADIDVDADFDRGKRKGSGKKKGRFHMPSFNFPKGKGKGHGDADVDIDLNVEGDVKGPKMSGPDVDLNVDGGAGGNIKLPEGGVSVGGAGIGVDIDGKKPDIDLSGKGPDVSFEGDVAAPDADVNVSVDGKKKGFHLPSFGFGFKGKRDGGSSDSDSDDDKKCFSLKGGIKGPKIKGDAGGKLKGPEISGDVNGPDFDVKGGGGIGFGVAGGIDVPKGDVDVNLPKGSIDVEGPELGGVDKSLDVSVKAPKPKGDISVDVPSGKIGVDADIDGDADFDRGKRKGSGKKKGRFHMPSIHFPKGKGKGHGDADVDIDLNVEGDVKGPKVSGPDVDLNVDGGAGGNIKLPEGGVSVGGAGIGVDIEGKKPDIDLSVKGPDVSFDGDVAAPDADVNVSVDGKKKGFHLPSFGFGFKGKRDGGSSDSDSDDDKKSFGLKGGIKGPKIKGDAGGKLKGPEISGDVNGPDFDVKGGGGIGFGVSGGIDVPKGDVDLNLPKGSIDVEGPELGGVDKSLDVSVKSAKPKGDISVDVPSGKIGVDADIDLDADFDRGKRKGSGKKKGRFHMPSIHFPKGKGKGHGDADVDIDLNVEGDVKGPKVSGPDVDLNVDGGAGGNIKLPEGGVSIGGAGIGVDIEGKRPDIDLSGKGPDVSFDGDVAAPDADVNVSVDGKKKGFHLPSFGFGFKGKRDGGSSDSDSDDDKKGFGLKGGIKGPKIKGDAGGKLKGPEISGDVNGPDFDVKGGGGIGFGVAGGIDVPKGDVDVNLPKGSIDVEGPELGGVDKSLDVSVKSAKPKGDISVDVPSGKIGVDADIDLDADFDRGKRKGSGKKKGRFHMPSINMPSIHFPKGKGKGHGGADVDIDLNVEGDVKGPKVSGPDVDLNVDGGAGGNIKLPEGGVSVGGAGIGVDIDGKKPDIDLFGKGPDVSFEGDVAAPDADVNLSLDAKKKSPKKKGGFHLPSFGFGLKGKGDKSSSSDSDSDEGKDFGFKGDGRSPKLEGGAGIDLKGPEVGIKGGADIDIGASGDISPPKHSVGIEGPDLGGVNKSLNIDVKAPRPDVSGELLADTPDASLNIGTPDVSFDTEYDGSLKLGGKDKSSGKKKKGFHMPSFGLPKIRGKGDYDLNHDADIDVGADGKFKKTGGIVGVSLDGEFDVDTKKPDTDISGPKVQVEAGGQADFDLERGDKRGSGKRGTFGIPSLHFGKSKHKDSKDVDVDVDVSPPRVSGSVDGKKKGSPKKKKGKFGLGFGSKKDGELDAGGEIVAPNIEVDVKAAKSGALVSGDLDLVGAKDGEIDVNAPKGEGSISLGGDAKIKGEVPAVQVKGGKKVKAKKPKRKKKGGFGFGFGGKKGEKSQGSSSSSSSSSDSESEGGMKVKLPSFGVKGKTKAPDASGGIDGDGAVVGGLNGGADIDVNAVSPKPDGSLSIGGIGIGLGGGIGGGLGGDGDGKVDVPKPDGSLSIGGGAGGIGLGGGGFGGDGDGNIDIDLPKPDGSLSIGGGAGGIGLGGIRGGFGGGGDGKIDVDVPKPDGSLSIGGGAGGIGLGGGIGGGFGGDGDGNIDIDLPKPDGSLSIGGGAGGIGLGGGIGGGFGGDRDGNIDIDLPKPDGSLSIGGGAGGIGIGGGFGRGGDGKIDVDVPKPDGSLSIGGGAGGIDLGGGIGGGFGGDGDGKIDVDVPKPDGSLSIGGGAGGIDLGGGIGGGFGGDGDGNIDIDLPKPDGSLSIGGGAGGIGIGGGFGRGGDGKIDVDVPKPDGSLSIGGGAGGIGLGGGIGGGFGGDGDGNIDIDLPKPDGSLSIGGGAGGIGIGGGFGGDGDGKIDVDVPKPDGSLSIGGGAGGIGLGGGIGGGFGGDGDGKIDVDIPKPDGSLSIGGGAGGIGLGGGIGGGFGGDGDGKIDVDIPKPDGSLSIGGGAGGMGFGGIGGLGGDGDGKIDVDVPKPDGSLSIGGGAGGYDLGGGIGGGFGRNGDGIIDVDVPKPDGSLSIGGGAGGIGLGGGFGGDRDGKIDVDVPKSDGSLSIGGGAGGIGLGGGFGGDRDGKIDVDVPKSDGSLSIDGRSATDTVTPKIDMSVKSKPRFDSAGKGLGGVLGVAEAGFDVDGAGGGLDIGGSSFGMGVVPKMDVDVKAAKPEGSLSVGESGEIGGEVDVDVGFPKLSIGRGGGKDEDIEGGIGGDAGIDLSGQADVKIPGAGDAQPSKSKKKRSRRKKKTGGSGTSVDGSVSVDVPSAEIGGEGGVDVDSAASGGLSVKLPEIGGEMSVSGADGTSVDVKPEDKRRPKKKKKEKGFFSSIGFSRDSDSGSSSSSSSSDSEEGIGAKIMSTLGFGRKESSSDSDNPNANNNNNTRPDDEQDRDNRHGMELNMNNNANGDDAESSGANLKEHSHSKGKKTFGKLFSRRPQQHIVQIPDEEYEEDRLHEAAAAATSSSFDVNDVNRMSSNRGDGLHASHSQKSNLSKSLNQKEGKVGTLGKLFGKKKTKKGTAPSAQEQALSSEFSRYNSIPAESNDSLDVSLGSGISYCPAEFLASPRSSMDSASSFSKSSKKRAAPPPPTTNTSLKGNVPRSPLSEESFTFSSSSSIETPPHRNRKTFSSTKSAELQTNDKRYSAASLPDIYSKQKHAHGRSLSLETSKKTFTTQLSNLSTSSLLADRGIVYSSIEDLNVVAEAVKELPLPQGAPPPKPKRFSSPPNILAELEVGPEYTIASGDEHVDEHLESFVVPFPSDAKDKVGPPSTSDPNSMEKANKRNNELPVPSTDESSELSHQEKEQMTKFRQIYMFDTDMFAPQVGATEDKGFANVNKKETKSPAEVVDKSPSSTLSKPELSATSVGKSQPLNDAAQVVDKHVHREIQVPKARAQKDVTAPTNPDSESANTERRDGNHSKESEHLERNIPDFSVVRQMAKEAISSNNERSTEIKAILKRSMAKMMGVSFPVRSAHEMPASGTVQEESKVPVEGNVVVQSNLDSLERSEVPYIDTEHSCHDKNEFSVYSMKEESPEQAAQESMIDQKHSVKTTNLGHPRASNGLPKLESETQVDPTEKEPLSVKDTYRVVHPAETASTFLGKESDKQNINGNEGLNENVSSRQMKAERKSIVTRSNSLQKRKNSEDTLSKSSVGLTRSKSFGAKEWNRAVQKDQPFDFERANPEEELQKLASLNVVKAVRSRFGGAESQSRKPNLNTGKEMTTVKTSQSLSLAKSTEEPPEFIKAQSRLRKVSLHDESSVHKEQYIHHPVQRIPPQGLKYISPLRESKRSTAESSSAPAPLAFAGVGRVMYQSKVTTWKKSSDIMQQKEEMPAPRKNVTDDSSLILASVSSWKGNRVKRKSVVENFQSQEKSTRQNQVMLNPQEIDAKYSLAAKQTLDDVFKDHDQAHIPEVQDVDTSGQHSIPKKEETESVSTETELVELRSCSSNQDQQSLSTSYEPTALQDVNIHVALKNTGPDTDPDKRPVMEKSNQKPQGDAKDQEVAHLKRHKEIRERTQNLLAKIKVAKTFQTQVFIDDMAVQLRGKEESAQIRDRRRNIYSTPPDDPFQKSDIQPEAHKHSQVVLPQITDRGEVNTDIQSYSAQQRVRKVRRKSHTRRLAGDDADRGSLSSTEELSEDETPRRQHFSPRQDSGYSDMASHSEIDRHVLPHKGNNRRMGGKMKQPSPRTSPKMHPKHSVVSELPSSKPIAEVAPDGKNVPLLDAAELQRIVIHQQEEMRLLRQQMQASQISQIQVPQMQSSQMQVPRMNVPGMQASQVPALPMQASQMQTSQMQAPNLQTSLVQTPYMQAPQLQVTTIPNINSGIPAGNIGSMGVTASPHVPSVPFMYSNNPNMMPAVQQQQMYYVPHAGMQAQGLGMQGPGMQMPGVIPMSNYSPYAPFPVQGMFPMQTRMQPAGMQVQGSAAQYPTSSHLQTMTSTGGTFLYSLGAAEPKHGE